MSQWLCSNLLHWLSLYIFTLLYNMMLNCPCRILVGVPNGTTTDHRVDRTGYVLECPLSPGPCEPLRGSGEGNDTLLYDETSGLPMTNIIGRCFLYRSLPNIRICIHITFFLHIYSGLVGCDARLVGCDARLVGCDARLVGCDARLVGCDAGLVGCDARLVGCDAGLVRCSVSTWNRLERMVSKSVSDEKGRRRMAMSHSRLHQGVHHTTWRVHRYLPCACIFVICLAYPRSLV